jgi:parallel beta-helix repeat protein
VAASAAALLVALTSCSAIFGPAPGSVTAEPTVAATTSPSAPVDEQVSGCPAGTLISTADELTSALAAAVPGAVLLLAPGAYAGQFVAETSGTEGNPITLCGSRDSIIEGGAIDGGYALHLNGASYWVLQGFSVIGGQKGIMLDGSSHDQITGLSISGTGDEALHLRASSQNNLIQGNEISGTGQRNAKYGEGIYIGTAESNWCDVSNCVADPSDGNSIVGNTIWNTTAENIDIKEGTTGGDITSNSLDGGSSTAVDSLLDVKGSGWTIAQNVGINSPKDGAQVHVIGDTAAANNVFETNTFAVASDGVGVNLSGDARYSGNRVACDNIVTVNGTPGAADLLSNVECSG